MSELAAEQLQGSRSEVPTSRFNRTQPHGYGGFRFASNPDLPEVPESEEDQFYTLGAGDQCRPDLVAFKLYGDSNLWWFLVLVNEDVLKDGKLNFLEKFLPGVTLRIPPQQTAFSYVNGRI